MLWNCLYTAKKAMKYERFGNCLTNARQKSRYVFGQNFTDLVYYGTRMRTKITIIDSAIEIEIATEQPTEIDFAIEFGIDLVIEFPIDFVIVLAIDC